MNVIEANYKQLSSGSVDIVLDAIEYAYPRTVEGIWKTLDAWLSSGRITETTYQEIKNAVTLESVAA